MTRNAIVIGAAALAIAVGGCASVRGTQDAPAASISSEDGTWRGKVGKADASGTAWLDRHGWLVLSGSVGPSDGHQEVVYYELRGDSVRRWGEIAATFSGGRV